MLFLFLVGLALIIPGLAIPVFSKIFVDQILISQSQSWIIPLLTGIALTTLLRALLSWLQQYSLIRFEMSLSLKNSSKFLWHCSISPCHFISSGLQAISPLVSISTIQVAALLSGPLWKYPSESFNDLCFYAALMFYYSIPLALIAIAVSLVNLLALRYISRKRVDSNQKTVAGYQSVGWIFFRWFADD